MHPIHRFITNICSAQLVETKSFYVQLFDFEVRFDSDWFVHLSAQNGALELGIIDQQSELIPRDFEVNPKGIYLTIVVEDSEAVYQTALQLGVEILQPPAPTFYGQKRLLLKDPNGVLVDVSSPDPTVGF